MVSEEKHFSRREKRSNNILRNAAKKEFGMGVSITFNINCISQRGMKAFRVTFHVKVSLYNR